MSMTRTRVSVCMPTYNYARFLPAAIESVLSQKFSDFEFLIIDDCSGDDTRRVVEGFAAKDDRIVFSVNERNIGMVENWNLCIARARGEYIKFLFGDDMLSHQNALGIMVARMDADDGISLVGSPRYLIDEGSSVVEQISCLPAGTVAPGTDIINRCLLDQRNQNLIGEPSVVMFRKCQARRGFNPNYKQLVDLEMWFHLLEQGKYAHMAENLSSFRVHSEQQTTRNILTLAYIDDLSLLYDEYLGKEYIECGHLHKRFLVYNQYYKIWKKARQRKIDKGVTRQKIASRYRSWEFFAHMPFYKIYNPCQKLGRLAAKLLGRNIDGAGGS
jgi:glycosyltransferase involved in cell wall biosynthesis